jgi:hypothetical protein
VKTIGLVYGVARLVAKNTPGLGFSSPLHLQHLASLQPHQARMREVKRDGKANNTIRIEEFLGQPRMGKGCNVARLELPMQPLHASVE